MAKTKPKKGAKAPAYDGSLDNKLKTCPHCNERGRVGKKFGIRFSGGKHRPQPWCRKCRGKKPEPTVEYAFEVCDDAMIVVEEIVNDPTNEPLTLGTGIESTRILFNATFPNNQQKYGWLTMARRLVKKLGDRLTLTPEADLELNGVGI